MSLIYDGEDYYHLLGVPTRATPDEIKSAYRQLVRLTHPDARPHGDTGMCFQHVKRAYEVLSDPAKRANYDRIMGFNQATPSGYACRTLRATFAHFFSGIERVMAHANQVTHELSDELPKKPAEPAAAEAPEEPTEAPAPEIIEEPRRMAG